MHKGKLQAGRMREREWHVPLWSNGICQSKWFRGGINIYKQKEMLLLCSQSNWEVSSRKAPGPICLQWQVCYQGQVCYAAPHSPISSHNWNSLSSKTINARVKMSFSEFPGINFPPALATDQFSSPEKWYRELSHRNLMKIKCIKNTVQWSEMLDVSQTKCTALMLILPGS